MAAITPIRDEELDFDHGTFDSAAFTRQTLSSWQSLAQVIDHTLLKPEAIREQIECLCDEAIRYRFACAMVNPMWVPTAVEILSGTVLPVGVGLNRVLHGVVIAALELADRNHNVKLISDETSESSGFLTERRDK